ncbi:hypothetical protein FQN57_001212 [Myotisia sp. PD_48]|nr:hypothetical protein FQN57_001212 [Myotisia sp. PD_48]
MPNPLMVRNHARTSLLRVIARRHLSLTPIISIIPPVLLPPVVFIGLTITLWAYKCMMMIIFQNKIIYMPSMPPFSRREKIADYQKLCGSIKWKEERTRSLDGVEIALCVGSTRSGNPPSLNGNTINASANNANTNTEQQDAPLVTRNQKHIVILYFQGNGSSLPPRLPHLSAILNGLAKNHSDPGTAYTYTLVGVSYRGYWTSRGRASERGIHRDAIAALRWARHRFQPTTINTTSATTTEMRIVLWGQSIGAGVATSLAATDFHQLLHDSRTGFLAGNGSGSESGGISGIILETPFRSIKAMLLALYPQRWLPYRYLSPFLRSWWDSEAAIQKIALRKGEKLGVLIVSAEHDELVPAGEADALEQMCKSVDGVKVFRTDVKGALHNDATARGEGVAAVVRFLKGV